MQVIGDDEAVRVLTAAIDMRDTPSMLESIKLLAALCLVPPNGYAALIRLHQSVSWNV